MVAGRGPAGYAELRDEVASGELGPPEEALGWFHEAWHDADRRDAFARARGAGARIGAADAVAASRIYTPPHLVAFLLQNSVGARWVEMHPDSTLADRWPYLVRGPLRPGRASAPLRDLTILDPCCGCGAFLVPAFDMLVEMYAEERRLAELGAIPADWAVPEDAVERTILSRNLSGVDVDAGAVAIATELLEARGGGGAQLATVPLPIGSLARANWQSRRFDVIVANPPYVGFRMLDATLKAAVRAEDSRARADLAIAFQSLCWELLAEGGMCATVTPAAWLSSRDGLPLRQAILDGGGPRLAVTLGQRVFDQAPLLFVGLSVVERGDPPRSVEVLRLPTGAGAAGLTEATRAGGTTVMRSVIEALRLRSFAAAAPAAVLETASRGPRLGELFDAVDGVWTGSNARDTRYWWEVGDDPGWVRMSGGQGNEPWAAAIRLCIRSEHVAGRVRESGVEYARVAGGRLAARAVVPGTAALAGVVTLVPRDGDAAARVPEVLAIFNSRIGLAWLQTLASGLNFNPGYAAEIPLGATPPPAALVAAVASLVTLRAELARRDPTSDTFTGTVPPWAADDLAERIADAELEAERLLAAHLGVGAATLADLPSLRRNRARTDVLDDHLGALALGALGFCWPGRSGDSRATLSDRALSDRIRVALDAEGAPELPFDLRGWVERRFLAAHTRRFRRRPVVERLDAPTRFRIDPARTGRAPAR